MKNKYKSNNVIDFKSKSKRIKKTNKKTNNRDKPVGNFRFKISTTSYVIGIIIIGFIFNSIYNNDTKKENQSTSNSEVINETESKEKETTKVEDELAEYKKQFDWSNNKIGVKIDSSASDGYGIATYVSGRLIIFGGTKDNYSYVQIQIPMYNEAGNYVGTALANVNNLKKGDTWQFEAIFSGKAKVYDSSNIQVDAF